MTSIPMIISVCFIFTLLATLIIVSRIQNNFRKSLPELSGKITTTALSTGHKITIETDGQGVPRITGKCPEDVAFGLGLDRKSVV